MPIAISPEQRALQESIREWAKRAGTLAAVRALEPAAPAGDASTDDQWSALAGLGIFSIALPAGMGGADGTVADVAAAVEELTYALVPGPVLPTLLAGLILRGHPDVPAVQELLPAVATGHTPVAVALTAGTLTGEWGAGGELRVCGETGPVLGAGAASHLLLGAATGTGEVWFLIPAKDPGLQVSQRAPVDFSRPVGTIRVPGALVAPSGILSGLDTGAVGDLAATLCCAEAAAVAGYCCDTAAAYARTRHQFGRPIGAFQAIKHLCAGMLCRTQSAAALAWDAARAADEAPGEHPLAAAAAAALALDAGVENAKDCIQVLGGIGFTWADDTHLYLRRALAVRQLLGGSARWRARAGELALTGARRQVRLVTGDGDRTGADGAGAGLAAVAADAQAMAGIITLLPPHRQRAALADAGYVAPHWPKPYGLGASPQALLVIDEELHQAGITRPDLVIGGWACLAIVNHGSQAQRDRFAGPTLRGEITWCQLFSEPDAGSDLAAVRTRAVRVPGAGDGGAGWRLTGQKVWTSLAHEADWAICLARTDPDVPKHRGLTYFLVDMHGAGIDIRPLREITGRAAFNEVFLDEVFVPDEYVVGAPGEGWRIARSTLATERVEIARGSALGEEAERLIGAVKAAGLAADPAVAGQVGALVASGLAGSLMDLRSAQARLAGADDSQLAAVRKLVGVAHRQGVAETALTLTGPEGAASDGVAADAVHEFLLSRCLSIAGGTTQILLNVVAERALGLPREEAR